MTLHVALVTPDGEIWGGAAQRVIVKTLEGDIGILAGHSPVLGVIATGSVVRILPEDEASAAGPEILAAVSGGFLAVADDRVSILAQLAELGSRVKVDAATAVIEAADAAGPRPGSEEPAEVQYMRAQLRAARG